ncbi:hypothetical protein, partial [Pseudomonas paracarnis]
PAPEVAATQGIRSAPASFSSSYIEASTNPLPSGYVFNAASPIAKLQHGYVNPLPKETLHHG